MQAQWGKKGDDEKEGGGGEVQIIWRRSQAGDEYSWGSIKYDVRGRRGKQRQPAFQVNYTDVVPRTLLCTGCCTRLSCIKIFSISTVYKMSFVLFGTVSQCCDATSIFKMALFFGNEGFRIHQKPVGKQSMEICPPLANWRPKWPNFWKQTRCYFSVFMNRIQISAFVQTFSSSALKASLMPCSSSYLEERHKYIYSIRCQRQTWQNLAAPQSYNSSPQDTSWSALS